MDFFAQQDAARKKSARLTVVALVFAVLVAAATGFVFTVAAWCGYLALTDRAPTYLEFIAKFPEVCTLSHIGAVVVVLVAGAWSYVRLGAGEALMKSVGARRARRSGEQVCLNVVEEMSIASGADVPTAWVVDEDDGVNAFAAGLGEEQRTHMPRQLPGEDGHVPALAHHLIEAHKRPLGVAVLEPAPGSELLELAVADAFHARHDLRRLVLRRELHRKG